MNLEEVVVRLHEIETRAAKATAGPWCWGDDWQGLKVSEPDEYDGDKYADLQLMGARESIIGLRIDHHQPEWDVRDPREAPNAADRAFIATARDDVPWLCARLREALGLSPSSDATRPHE